MDDVCHGRHAHILNSGDHGSRRAGWGTLGGLHAKERVEESDAEFSTAGEVHEEVDRVVGVVEQGDQCVEQPSCRPLLRCHIRECSIGVAKEIDINGNTEHEEQDANNYQHHSCRRNLHT